MSYSTVGRIGDQVLFDTWDVYYNACGDLIEMKPLAGTVSASYARRGLASFRLYHHDIDPKTLEMSFYVGGNDADEVEANVSTILARAKQCIIKTGKTDYEYPAVLTGYTDTETGVENYHLLVLRFAALKRLPMVEQTFQGTGNGNVQNLLAQGTAETGCKLEVTFTSAQETALVQGTTIKNVPANTVFTIDGIEGKVECNGENRLEDTDLIKFPTLTGGSVNLIDLPLGCTCKVSYYPTFV